MPQSTEQRFQCVDFTINSTQQFRDALERLRFLERAAERSSLGRERASLELTISLYLLSRERSAS